MPRTVPCQRWQSPGWQAQQYSWLKNHRRFILFQQVFEAQMVFDYLFEGRLYWGKIWGSTLQCPWRLVLVTSLAPSLRSLVSLSVISDLCWQWCLRGSRSLNVVHTEILGSGCKGLTAWIWRWKPVCLNSSSPDTGTIQWGRGTLGDEVLLDEECGQGESGHGRDRIGFLFSDPSFLLSEAPRRPMLCCKPLLP